MKRVTDEGFISPILTMDSGMGGDMRMTDAAIANGQAFLISELEKRDPLIRQPLTSVTWARDVPVNVGGGWVEFETALNIDYGDGGSGDNSVTAAGSNVVSMAQSNLDKDIWPAHVYSKGLRIPIIAQLRQQIAGRSLDQMLTDGVRLSYDKHMDQNVYLGVYGRTGLLNDAGVSRSTVAPSAGSASSTRWINKTPDEILYDVNKAIELTWAGAGYDREAIPNHLLIDYANFAYIIGQKVSTAGNVSILQFLRENNIAKENGGELFIGATRFNATAALDGGARMAVYVHAPRFLEVSELAPLNRMMTAPNPTFAAYDSLYQANVGALKLFYLTTLTYWDGI